MVFGYEIVVILIMIIMNAFFAAYEMALASISRARLSFLLNEKKKGAEAAVYMKDRMEASLAVVQLGITLVGAVAAAIGGAGVNEMLKPYLMRSFGFSETIAEILSLICLVVPLSCLTITFAELVPKMFAFTNREWVCLKMSPFMKRLSHFVYPLVRIFEAVVKKSVGFGSNKLNGKKDMGDYVGLHELKAAASFARSSRLIGAGQEKIVLSAADLSSRPISSIMLPASEISMISLKASMNDALVKAHMEMHTRFPVCEKENDPQTIRGYISFKDIIDILRTSPDKQSVQGITRPIKSIKTDVLISDALTQMIQSKIHIALVVTWDDRVVGMVTLEDIIEELVGEIEDEYDRLPTHIHAYGSSWILGGGAPMSAVYATILKQNFVPDSKVPGISFSEWINKRLGRPLQSGETFQIETITITVRKLRRKKLYEAVVTIADQS
ncbi:MAG: hemolysin family protein [Candidatus Omnitrophota bacterium]